MDLLKAASNSIYSIYFSVDHKKIIFMFTEYIYIQTASVHSEELCFFLKKKLKM